MKNITVIGDGGWGTALALILLDNKHSVTLWGPFPDYINTMASLKENQLYLKGVRLPDSLKFTSNREDAVKGADIVVLAVPSKFFREVCESFRPFISRNAIFVSVAKGFDPKTQERMSETAEGIFGTKSIVALSGPSHAEEVARKIPTTVTAACKDISSAKIIQQVFSNKYFRVYTSDDVIGVELGGVLKNVIAIAVGASDGMGFGDNTRAALITRGIAEITRLGVALGARAQTFAGLSGMGDLIVTCTSIHSRNRNVGERLGRGEKIEQIMASMKQVAEGVWNCSVARELAIKLGIDAPITEEVYQIINHGKNPCDAVSSLLSRELKPE